MFRQNNRTESIICCSGLLYLAQCCKCGIERVYLADDRVVGGGDCVKDPLDALERLLVASGDAVEGLVVVLQRTTALTEGERKSTDFTWI